MRNENENKAETPTERVEAILRGAAKTHPRAEWARRFYSAEITGSEWSDAATVNLFCFSSRDRDKLTKALKNAVGKSGKVAPVEGSEDGETANWRVTFAA